MSTIGTFAHGHAMPNTDNFFNCPPRGDADRARLQIAMKVVLLVLATAAAAAAFSLRPAPPGRSRAWLASPAHRLAASPTMEVLRNRLTDLPD